MSDRDKLIAEASDCAISLRDYDEGQQDTHMEQAWEDAADLLDRLVAELVRDTPEDTEWEYAVEWGSDPDMRNIEPMLDAESGERFIKHPPAMEPQGAPLQPCRSEAP